MFAIFVNLFHLGIKNRTSINTKLLHQGSAWDGMGRKKSSHGIDILQTIPWDDFLRPIPSHAEPCFTYIRLK